MRNNAVDRCIRRERVGASPRGFTLIELLVVVAIIALLISILLPSLSAAREQAKATKCAANLSSCGKAVANYLAENRANYPLSYYYASDANGGYDINRQSLNREWGYIHWSYQLFENGKVQDEAFQCPSMENAGHPRTDPGPDSGNWSSSGEQVDFGGNPAPTGNGQFRVEDRQAKWMAFTANRAIMPLNRLGNVRAQNPKNRFVRESEIEDAGKTILATEFVNNWKAISQDMGGRFQSKSHRSIMPFSIEGVGYDEFSIPPDMSLDLFTYWSTQTDRDYGLLQYNRLEDADSLVESGARPLNLVGRHHPGGDRLGGTTNFLFSDGHVARKTILKTLQDREWGKAYYGLTGKNRVSDRGWTQGPPNN